MEALLAIDAALLRGILALPHPDWLNAVCLAASRVGTGGTIWLSGGVVLFVFGRIARPDLLRLFLAIIVVHVVIDLGLKPWFDRPRPPVAIAEIQPIGDVPETLSFPSGHAANSSAGAFVLTTAWPNASGRALIWSLAVLVGLARVYLGVHYPFDALAGAVVGLLIGWAAWSIQVRRRAPPSRPLC